MDVLLDAALNCAGVGVDDAQLLKEIEVTHVNDSTVHLLVAHVLDFTNSLKRGKLCTHCIRIEQVLDELIGANRVEDLVIAEFANEQVLV